MPGDAPDVGRWSRFEMVTFSKPTGIPHGWDMELVSKGVPKDLLGAYQAANGLALLEAQWGEQFVCFGVSGHDDYFCLNPRTGAVVDIVYVATSTINRVSGVQGPPIFVNSSLDQFIASVRAVVNRFPFESSSLGQTQGHGQDDLANLWELVSEELFETLRRIDPVALADLDGFWMTFVSDVQMGDYSTEMILRHHNE